jgi:hypothetical protein
MRSMTPMQGKPLPTFNSGFVNVRVM